MLSLIFVLYVMLGDLKLNLSTKTTKYKFEFNGIVWCMLDLLSRIRYEAFDEEVLRLISFSKEKI